MKMDSVVHFEMPAVDKKRVADFYSKVFGWQMQLLGKEMDEYLLATTTESDENGPKRSGAINGGFYTRDDSKPGFSQPHVVIAVDNIKESMKKVREGGGEVLGKPVEIPGVGLYISFKDTEGNHVGILQPSTDMPPK